MTFSAERNVNPLAIAIEELDDFFVSYAVYLVDGNTLNGLSIKVATIRQYLTCVNDHFAINGHKRPIDFKNKSSKVMRLLNDQEKYKTTDRRIALPPVLVHAMMYDVEGLDDPLGLASAIKDVLAAGRYLGFRKQEIAQDKEDEVLVYIKPNGERITRAFCVDDIELKDEHNQVVSKDGSAKKDSIASADWTFSHQKNNETDQTISVPRVTRRSDNCCPLTATLSSIKRSRDLGQADDQPMFIYKDSDGNIRYLTGTVITEYFRKIARDRFPGIPETDIKCISTHSLRVTACVLLHEAGKDGSYIKLRLRWKSDCYALYLRNTAIICQQHAAALEMADEQLEDMRPLLL